MNRTADGLPMREAERGSLTYFLPYSMEQRTVCGVVAFAGGDSFVFTPDTGDLMDRFTVSASDVIGWVPVAAASRD